MERVQMLLNQILRNSLLSKSEKKEWMEEMQTHFDSSINSLEEQGYSKEEAIKKAIINFGDPIQIRKQLTKDMYGFTSGTILIWASFFLVMFVYSSFLLPDTLSLFESIFLACFIGTILLIKTRKKIDRVLLPVAYLPFFIAILASYFVPKLGWYLAFISNFWFPMNLFGATFLLIFGISLYLISKNLYIASLPLLYSIFSNLWHINELYVVQLRDIELRLVILAYLIYLLRRFGRRKAQKSTFPTCN